MVLKVEPEVINTTLVSIIQIKINQYNELITLICSDGCCGDIGCLCVEFMTKHLTLAHKNDDFGRFYMVLGIIEKLVTQSPNIIFYY